MYTFEIMGSRDIASPIVTPLLLQLPSSALFWNKVIGFIDWFQKINVIKNQSTKSVKNNYAIKIKLQKKTKIVKNFISMILSTSWEWCSDKSPLFMTLKLLDYQVNTFFRLVRNVIYSCLF